LDVSTFFLKLLILLLSAKFFAEIFARLKLPSVLGEVIAGVILGPSLLDVVRPDAVFHLLAEIGILLLLFEVGLETDIGQLTKVGVQSTLVAVTGVILPAFLGYYFAHHILGLPFIAALFIGGTLVATSIGITVRVLADLRRQRTKTAQVVLGAAVIDDVVGVVILALLYDFVSTGEVSILKTLKVLMFISLFMVLAPVVARFLSLFIGKLSDTNKTKGMLPTLIISLILGMAVLSHEVGAPEILGSFAAGIALARRFFLPLAAGLEHYSHGLAEKIEVEMKSIIDLFVPIFFVVVGASMDLRVIDFGSQDFWMAALGLSCVAIAAKMASGVWVKGGWNKKLATGVAMVPRGEVGLIFAEVGKKAGVLNEVMYAVVVFVVGVTTLVAPLALRIILRREDGDSTT